jgi:hypothetical protein
VNVRGSKLKHNCLQSCHDVISESKNQSNRREISSEQQPCGREQQVYLITGDISTKDKLGWSAADTRLAKSVSSTSGMNGCSGQCSRCKDLHAYLLTRTDAVYTVPKDRDLTIQTHARSYPRSYPPVIKAVPIFRLLCRTNEWRVGLHRGK